MGYEHELSNYRIALKRHAEKWQKARDGGTALWNKVLGNALRLAEAVDRTDGKQKEPKKA